MPTTPITPKQRTEMQAKFTTLTTAVSAVQAAGVTTALAAANEDKKLLQEVVSREGGAPLT